MAMHKVLVGGLFALAFLVSDVAMQDAEAGRRKRRCCCYYQPIVTDCCCQTGWSGAGSYGYGSPYQTGYTGHTGYYGQGWNNYDHGTYSTGYNSGYGYGHAGYRGGRFHTSYGY